MFTNGDVVNSMEPILYGTSTLVDWCQVSMLWTNCISVHGFVYHNVIPNSRAYSSFISVAQDVQAETSNEARVIDQQNSLHKAHFLWRAQDCSNFLKCSEMRYPPIDKTNNPRSLSLSLAPPAWCIHTHTHTHTHTLTHTDIMLELEIV